MNLFAWIFFGIIIGIISHLVNPQPSAGGFIGALVLGVLGSMLGGLTANLVLGAGMANFDFTSLFIAIIGSVVLLFAGVLLKANPET